MPCRSAVDSGPCPADGGGQVAHLGHGLLVAEPGLAVPAAELPDLTPPWSLLFVDGAPLTLCVELEGSGWIIPEGRPPEQVATGEMLIVRGPAPFAFVDEVGTRAEPIECGQDCATPDQGGTRHRLGWNDCSPGDPPRPSATTLITGAYPVRCEIGRRLLDALPDVLRLAPSPPCSWSS